MQYAVALAETGHFGRAAEMCHVTQPGLSQQIRQLEEHCGAPLFDRLGKSVQPTPLGRELIDRMRPILQQTEALEIFVAAQHGQPARPIRLGVIPTVAPYLLPHAFPALQRELPSVSFIVSESRTDTLIDGLGNGTLDLALIASEPKPGGPRLAIEPLFDDQFVLATGPDDKVSGPVPLDRINGNRMLLLDEGHCFREQAIAACGIEQDAAGRTFAATSLSTIVEFVANGQGITLLPEIALRKEASDRIRIHPLQSPGAHRQLRLVWREGSPFRKVFDSVAETIRSARPAQAPTG